MAFFLSCTYGINITLIFFQNFWRSSSSNFKINYDKQLHTFRKILSCPNTNDLHTIRCRIVCWFQKCITLYAYLEYFGKNSQIRVKKRWFWLTRKIKWFFDTNLAVFPKIIKISIWSYTFLKSAHNSASNGIQVIGVCTTFYFSKCMELFVRIDFKIQWRWPPKILKKNQGHIYTIGTR